MTASKRRRVLVATAGALVVALVSVVVTAVIVAAVSSSETNERGANRVEQNQRNDETLALIKDCTQPDGECFKRGQRRTAAAVGDINRVVILAASCASGPVKKSVEEIQSCVIARLAD